MKEKYSFIFVVLVYKNYNDLMQFVPQVKEIRTRCKIIVVNSYYSQETYDTIKDYCAQNECDFLNVPNKGYGAGNNAGIRYAMENYYFNYLVVCNSDVDIKQFPMELKDGYSDKVVAPYITNIEGKFQNPYWVHFSYLGEKLMYLGYKRHVKLLLMAGIALFKIPRELFVLWFKHTPKREAIVAGAHGCFVLFPYKVLKQIGTPYDENMFLFAEESLLAHTLKKSGIKTVMTKDIEIVHHECGSINTTSIDQLEARRKSVVYYYEKVYGRSEH